MGGRSRARRRRDPRTGRRIRGRQVDDRTRRRAPSPGARARGGWRDPIPGARPPRCLRRRDATAPRRRHHAHPAGPTLRAQPRLPHRPAGDGRPPDPPWSIAEGGRRGDGPAPRPPRNPRADGRSPTLPARAVRRDAATGPHRDGVLLRADAGHRRRADDGPRRHHPGPDPAASRGASGRAPRRDALRHARPGRSRAPGPPRRRDVRGLPGGVGADRGPLPVGCASVHPRPPGAGAPGRRPRGGERRARWAHAGPRGATRGLPVP